MTEAQSIGMMEGAFFVPKGELLHWVNTTLKLNVSCIEQLGTGAVYCNLLDAMFPGKVAMQRVNWQARNEWQFINNFKILQQAFGKCLVQKYIDIEKLSKSKYQDNLEFIQWLKRYFDLHNKNNLESYDAEAARRHAPVDFTFVDMRRPVRRGKDTPPKNVRKSKSPYSKVRSKINNRSSTVAKPKKESSQYYLNKLERIKKIIKEASKGEDKIHCIEEILEEIDDQMVQGGKLRTEQDDEKKHFETVESKKVIKRNQ